MHHESWHRPYHATCTCIHIRVGLRQTGHASMSAEQSPHTHWWPHGTAICDLGLVKHTMHVVWPPMVDSGTSGRPVSKRASASETTAGGDGTSVAGDGTSVAGRAMASAAVRATSTAPAAPAAPTAPAAAPCAAC